MPRTILNPLGCALNTAGRLLLNCNISASFGHISKQQCRAHVGMVGSVLIRFDAQGEFDAKENFRRCHCRAAWRGDDDDRRYGVGSGWRRRQAGHGPVSRGVRTRMLGVPTAVGCLLARRWERSIPTVQVTPAIHTIRSPHSMAIAAVPTITAGDGSRHGNAVLSRRGGLCLSLLSSFSQSGRGRAAA